MFQPWLTMRFSELSAVRWLLPFACLWLVMPQSARGDDKPADPVAAAFAQADADGDKRLTLEEFRKRPGRVEVHDRDFRLFDFDRDQRLSRREFEAIPGATPGPRGGEIPDPVQDLWTHALVAVDAAYGDWDRRPEVSVPARVFAVNFHGSVYPEGVGEFGENLVLWADPNGDGKVERQEGRRFLSLQLGLLTHGNQPIREPGGRVLMWGRFLQLDADKSGSLSPEELASLKEGHLPPVPCHPGPVLTGELAPLNLKGRDLVAEFAAHDLDRNGKLSLGEYARWFGGDDPIERFCRGDADLDGRLDQAELEAVTSEVQRGLIPSNLRAFDDDGDGRLSLAEYQLSMLGNQVWTWEEPLDDRDGDGGIDFAEFDFGKRKFLLLLRCYFDRLDANRDLRLSPDEFPFTPGKPQEQPARAAGAPMLRLVPAQRAPN